MVKKTIEETYQKLTQREHVLLRSGMYIGSVKKQCEELWVPDPETYMMKKKIVEYSPGFMKIFDEVLTNATDHSFRHPDVTQIKIDYSQETGEISVYNNGPGIPVVEHQEHKMYVPELIFGHLLSGSNYDDSDSRTGAGTNGLGSKCNSLDTKIPLWNGEIKLAKDIKIGDILIGDDGNPRTVLSTVFGKGKMFEVSQNRGESYKVNDEHILTLHMPDHKVIFWNNNGWKILWWDNEHTKINSKHFKAIDNKIKCNECEIELHSNLNRHYKRQHPNKILPVKQRKLPNNKPDMNNEKILKAYNELVEFSKNIEDNNVFDISIKDYLGLSKTTQSRLAGVRGQSINWEYQDVELEPYVLGLWLGDGMKDGYSYACDGENDNELIDYLKEWGLKNDANLKQSNTNKYKYDFSSIDNFHKKGYAPLKKILQKYNLIKNKHIPKEYLINSREVRLKVLAGFIDTDGTLSRDGTRIGISQSWKHEQLIFDVLYLARSLGFCCSMTSGMAKYKLKDGEKRESKAYKVNISGNIEDIPTILLRKKCNNTKKQNTDKSTGQIKIKKIEETDYIGIHIDENERFLINDFTVTHNCTNIFSKKFVIETVDSNSGKKFIQEHSLNMTVKSKAKITSNSKSSYTKITFIPDYQRFDMENLEDDTIALINKRAIDCIACTASTVKIYLNGELLKGKGMTDYTKYYFDNSKVYNESFNERVKNKKGEFVEYIWEYTIVPSEHYEQVSFVNGNATNQGGKHVDYIMYQIINKLKVMLETKKKLKELKPNFIKDKLFLFLRATVANPVFNSQTKEQLTTASKDFGCVVQVSDKFIERLYKSSITEEIVEFCKAKEIATLSKTTDGRKTNKIYIPKLEDALWAGTNKSTECTLILTEGDSAATFAKWGRAVVGPEKFGVFPLLGKCLQNFTKIPLFNGEIKLAKDIQIGDILIGDDGNKRTVLTLYKGNGKMYEVFQDRGESYKVNDEHILTLCMPEHKSIYWYDEHSSWRTIYWDKTLKNIKAKEIQTSIKIECNECGIMMNNQSLKRHYLRRHKNVEFQKSKTIIDMNDLKVIEARKKLEEFLLNIDDNNIIDICIQDYFKVTKSHQRKLKGIRGECVKWDHHDVLLDPYVLGLWLGDGCKSGYSYACDGENDYQLIDYLKEWGKNNDANLKKINQNCYNFSSIENFGKIGCAPLKKILEKYNLIKNKHIPKEYLINSKEIRLKLLAGIIDTDGYVAPDGTIEISQSVQVHQQLTDDIVYLARSLGFYTHLKKKVTNYTYLKSGEKAEAYIINISGDTEEIPTILPRKKSTSTTQYNMRNSTGTIKIKKIDNCNYVGIGLDCNSRFVINDFTVTHNCLNVRQASISQLMNNQEINNLKQIIGLKQDQVYKNTNDLRYSKVMILTDADLDGYHIRGLLINFFHAQWPSLVKLNFIQTLKTPIVKAIKGKKVIEFYTEQDYHAWKQTVNPSTFNIKYFKGLGTSKKDDAKDTFNRIDKLRVDYYYKDKLCDESILLAFDKDKNQNKPSKKKTESESENGSEIVEEFVKCSDRRKEWLSNYDRDSYVEMKESRVSYQDMINKELIHFSIYDNSRSIPSLCDGLKPSQRKILYYMLKKNITNPIKVAQLSGYVSAECGYHHGEASLQGAIIGMAQDFVGSNNINLLYPDGSFGSRFMNGKDAASARYIFTHLTNTTQLLFNSNDIPLLKMCDDDGSVIEPEWYLPIIPMVLVNGCEGIGTGYSTFIPPFNPNNIIENLLRVLNDDLDPLPMKPWYHGFNGEIIDEGEGKYISKGKYVKMSDTQLKITELPIGMGITTYKEYLESLIENSSSMKRGEKKATKNKVRKVVLRDVQNKTKDENDAICFIVEFKDANNLADLIKSNLLENELKLQKSFSTNNMYLFNERMILTKYQTANDILLDFYDLRLDYYQLRKEYLEKKLKEELIILKAKMKFIKQYIDKELDINRKSKQFIVDLLKTKKYPLHEESYDYLLNLQVYAFTEERINKLSSECEKKQAELEFIQSKSNSDLWCLDLIQLKEKLKN
jgi:DNA gyrase/topoisomerase IV subunit B